MSADSSLRRRGARGLARVVVVLAVALPVCRGTRADESPAVLSLTGGTVSGRLVDAAEAPGRPRTILWQAPDFLTPLEFSLDAIRRIEFPPPAGGVPADETPPWRVDLVGGDAVVGRLVSIDDTHVAVSIAGPDAPPTIAVRRAEIRRIHRRGDGASFVWDGSLGGWAVSAPGDWERSARGIVNRAPFATLARPIATGDRFRVDLKLAWPVSPHTTIGFGEGTPTPSKRARQAVEAVRGGKPAAEPRSLPYRLELDDAGVVAIRDEADASGAGRAELGWCAELPEKGIDLSVFVDRTIGRMLVTEADGRTTLADVTLPPGDAPLTEGLRIEVGAGNVEIVGLGVSPWRDGEVLTDDGRSDALLSADGTGITGRVEALSPDGAAVTLRPATDGPPRSVPLDRIDQIRFADRPPAGDDPGPAFRVTDRFGTTLSGALSRIADGRAWIAHRAIDGETGLATASLASIESMASAPPAPPLPGRKGRFESDAASLPGCLVSVETPAGPTIGWLPVGSLGGAALAPTAEGETRDAMIVYGGARAAGARAIGWVGARLDYEEDRATIETAVEGSPLAGTGLRFPVRLLAVAPRGDDRFVKIERGNVEAIPYLIRGPEGAPVQLRVAELPDGEVRTVRVVRDRLRFQVDVVTLDEILEAHQRCLEIAGYVEKEAATAVGSVVVLVTGESFDGRVESIDETGVRVRPVGGDPTTIPSELVQAVELAPSPPKSITPEKFRSLTTLPRSQRQRPPTHLVRSSRGDYLRGRVVSMDDETLRIAVDADPRGKPTTIPRREVARVVWLHPESLEDDWKPPRSPAAGGTAIEAVSVAGTRSTLTPESIEGTDLVGSHPVLGRTRIDLGSVDRLLLGGQLYASPRKLPFSQWQVRTAPDPRNLPPRPKAAKPN